MLDQTETDPVFSAPFVSSIMRLEPEWIDYNGHLNMAYYNVLFDRTVDQAFSLVGIGADYVRTRRLSFFAAEVHVRYLREIHLNDPIRVTLQLLDYDAKRLHFFQEMSHATEGWISATSENMSLHVDMNTKRTAPFPRDILDPLAKMKACHATLPRPESAGRAIRMPARR